VGCLWACGVCTDFLPYRVFFRSLFSDTSCLKRVTPVEGGYIAFISSRIPDIDILGRQTRTLISPFLAFISPELSMTEIQIGRNVRQCASISGDVFDKTGIFCGLTCCK